MEGFVGVRKGAWDEEEDVLLKQCIETNGEGDWHRVPLRTGLKRCRKSCRLRWMNYLKPGLKRSKFEEDEVDLMIKLHKLLGNRWSLIAGRLPGRTANDVKNFWNTHLRKNEERCRQRETSKFSKSLSRHDVFRPQPRIFSKSFTLQCQKALLEELNRRKEQPTIPCPSPPPSQGIAAASPSPENEKEWWESMLLDIVDDRGEVNNCNGMIFGARPDLGQPLKTPSEVGDWIFEETQWDWWRGIEFDGGDGPELL